MLKLLLVAGESEDEVEGLLGDDWVFAHILHMCVPAPQAIAAEYEARNVQEKQILSLILLGKTGLLLIPQKCDDITIDRLCNMIVSISQTFMSCGSWFN